MSCDAGWQHRISYKFCKLRTFIHVFNITLVLDKMIILRFSLILLKNTNRSKQDYKTFKKGIIEGKKK